MGFSIWEFETHRFGNSGDMGPEVCQREICVELGFYSFLVTSLSELSRKNFVGYCES